VRGGRQAADAVGCEKKPGSDTDGLLHVGVLDLRLALGGLRKAEVYPEYDDQVRSRIEEFLVPIRTQGVLTPPANPRAFDGHNSRALPLPPPRGSLRLISGSFTTTNLHGC
jgi:hypothetical protein